MQIFTGYGLAVWIPAIIGMVMGLQLLGIIKVRMPQLLELKWFQPLQLMES